MYLKDLSPYHRQFSPYSKSQNTIRVSLLGNYSTSYYYIITFILTYIPSLIIEPTVVPTTRFRYTFTIKVTVLNKVKQYTTQSTSYNDVSNSHNLRAR